MYTYGWFMLRFNIKQQNSVKQLSFNKIIIKKKILPYPYFKSFPLPSIIMVSSLCSNWIEMVKPNMLGVCYATSPNAKHNSDSNILLLLVPCQPLAQCLWHNGTQFTFMELNYSSFPMEITISFTVVLHDICLDTCSKNTGLQWFAIHTLIIWNELPY